jgi:hypothetical protein
MLVGWKSFVRQVHAAAKQHERQARTSARRSERVAMVQHRELVRQHREYLQTTKQMQKERARQHASAEAEEYASYVKMLTSIHTDCSEPWNWHAVSKRRPPTEPGRTTSVEDAAHAALAAYSPKFLDRLFGSAAEHRAQLAEAVQRGAAHDQEQYEAAMHAHRLRLDQWNYQQRLAPGVLSLHPDACRAALSYVGAFDEFEGFSTRVTLEAVVQNAATFGCVIEDQEIVPAEEVKLTAGGKLSTKEMAAGKYWALYQDHVASCAIRIAREAYAITPIERVIVNVRVSRLDPSTGHMVCPTILAVHFTREALMRLNFAAIDPSESLKNFSHRMKFKKTAGFDPVEQMSSDEQWITT